LSSIATAAKQPKPFSTRKRVNRRILRFSILIGAIATVLSVILYAATVYPAVRECQATNQRALSEISCVGSTCDTSSYTTDWSIGGSDYIIDTDTRLIIDVPSYAANPITFAPLDYSDTEFITRFGRPASYTSIDGEVWRLYSRQKQVDGEMFEIIVGCGLKVPWRMFETPPSLLPDIDMGLRNVGDRIAASLANGRASVNQGRTAGEADGFEVVSARSQRVQSWGPWLPMLFPKDKPFPPAGTRPYVDRGKVSIVQADTNGRLLAVSLIPLGSVYWLALLIGFTFVSSTALTWFLSRKFLRNYFAVSGLPAITIEEASRIGEGQNVEFKRALSEDDAKAGNAEEELLKSIAAFANTNDGNIFIGIDDFGRVKGLNLDFKQRDRLEQKIRQLVRNRIKPLPPMQITFEDVSGLCVARICVARGDATAYMMNGVIYVRYGSSDVQAQPDDLRRLMAEYAF